jgi:phage-related protein
MIKPVEFLGDSLDALRRFQKKAEKTDKAAVDLARAQLKELTRGGR